MSSPDAYFTACITTTWLLPNSANAKTQDAVKPEVIYPMDDTEFMIGAYCYLLTYTPVLSTDLSSKSKEVGQTKFIAYLWEHALPFPNAKVVENLQNKFTAWATIKFPHADIGKVKSWYLENCMSESAAAKPNE